MSFIQLERAGHWNNSSISIAYLARLPAKFLRRMAGFQKSEGSYVLPRAAYKPPASLQVQIWPWLDHWLARVRARAQGKGWKAGGLAADDRAAAGFLELLVVLRDVLLQDLAILQKCKLPLLTIFEYMLTTIYL
jgi:Centromere DNA-binding protein complex CBF3 subunit, domain 2